MKKILLLIVLLISILSCNQKKTLEKEKVDLSEILKEAKLIRTPNKEYLHFDLENRVSKYSFFSEAILDTLLVSKKNNECFINVLDTLSITKRIANDLRVYDFETNDWALYLHPQVGMPKVTKLGDNEYKIVIEENFPIDGDWKGKWELQTIAEYRISSMNDYFKIWRDKSKDLNLKLDERKLEDIVRHMNSREICQYLDRRISDECSRVTELYAFLLFVDILNGGQEYVSEYLGLEEKYGLAFRGYKAEYLSGNQFILLMLNKIPLNDTFKRRIPTYVSIENCYK